MTASDDERGTERNAMGNNIVLQKLAAFIRSQNPSGGDNNEPHDFEDIVKIPGIIVL